MSKSIGATSGTVYRLDGPTRALCAVPTAQPNSHTFVVASCSIGEPNTVRAVSYRPDTDTITPLSSMRCDVEVHALSASHVEVTDGEEGARSLVAAVHSVSSGSTRRSAMLLAVSATAVAQVAVLPIGTQIVTFDPTSNANMRTISSDNELCVLSLQGGSVSVGTSKPLGGEGPVFASAWDPVTSALQIVAKGSSVLRVDVRDPIPSELFYGAHGIGRVRTVEFVASRPNTIVTAGDDGCIRYHDIRTGTMLFSVTSAHAHYIYSATPNPLNGELLLSASADRTVKMWHSPSALSTSPARESIVCRHAHTHLKDSVMAARWSATTPWVYAAVSYNAKLIVDTVPDATRTAVLLNSTP